MLPYTAVATNEKLLTTLYGADLGPENFPKYDFWEI